MNENQGTTQGAGTESLRMHPSIAQSWSLWSPIVGRTATTRLEALWKEFPEMTSAIVATSDGLHICSLGLSMDDAGRLAALNSSMFSVAAAETRIMAGAVPASRERPREQSETEKQGAVARTSVAISSGSTRTAVFGFVVEPFGQLLLGMSAQDIPLGTLMVRTRSAAQQISDALGSRAPSI